MRPQRAPAVLSSLRAAPQPCRHGDGAALTLGVMIQPCRPSSPAGDTSARTSPGGPKHTLPTALAVSTDSKARLSFQGRKMPVQLIKRPSRPLLGEPGVQGEERCYRGVPGMQTALKTQCFRYMLLNKHRYQAQGKENNPFQPAGQPAGEPASLYLFIYPLRWEWSLPGSAASWPATSLQWKTMARGGFISSFLGWGLGAGAVGSTGCGLGAGVQGTRWWGRWA